MRRIAPLAVGACLIATPAFSQDPAPPKVYEIERVKDPLTRGGPGDGVYGRFNGDLSLQIGMGVEVPFRPVAVRPLIVADFAFYQTAGFYASFRQAVLDSDPVLRVASIGLQLSPLFLLRWSEARETGHAFADLFIDSWTLSAGIHVDQLRSEHFGQPLGLEAGLGFGLPLLGRANGLWLRSRGQLLTGGGSLVPSGWLYLTYQGFAHLGVLGNH